MASENGFRALMRRLYRGESNVGFIPHRRRLYTLSAVVLLLGLINMMRGGSPNRSQQLMRWRVALQFVAIVIIMITVWAMGSHR